jgi:hypothetical protein
MECRPRQLGNVRPLRGKYGGIHIDGRGRVCDAIFESRAELNHVLYDAHRRIIGLEIKVHKRSSDTHMQPFLDFFNGHYCTSCFGSQAHHLQVKCACRKTRAGGRAALDSHSKHARDADTKIENCMPDPLVRMYPNVLRGRISRH